MDSDKTYKKNWLQYAKIFCLITPVIITLIVLILVSTIVFGRYFSPYPIEMRINNIEIMGSSILSIIGIAVTVWVGLNIYNVIERREVEDLKKINTEISEELKYLKSELKNISSDKERFDKNVLDVVLNSNEIKILSDKSDISIIMNIIRLIDECKISTIFLPKIFSYIEDRFDIIDLLNNDSNEFVLNEIRIYLFLQWYSNYDLTQFKGEILPDKDIWEDYLEVMNEYLKNLSFNDNELLDKMNEIKIKIDI